ncbi:hypothetical protein BC826DRAFT_346946 [Russula brevipes]|nr:hypothetical protein BC826DRAFT_346946 [Russula brevipes]
MDQDQDRIAFGGGKKKVRWMDGCPVPEVSPPARESEHSTRTCEGPPLRPVSQILLIAGAGRANPCLRAALARTPSTLPTCAPTCERKEALPSPPPPRPCLCNTATSNQYRKGALAIFSVSSPTIFTSTPPRSSFQRETPDSCTHMPQSRYCFRRGGGI